jgi:probable phosphoglycerate mutase
MEYRHTGRSDIPLTDNGRKRAERLRPLLRRHDFALVLTSPLSRARETAALAGYPDAVPDPDLLEWDYGEEEGRTTADIREDRPGWSIWTDGPRGGETIGQVATRVERVISRAVGAEGDTLVFAHAHVLRILTACWVDLHPQAAQRFSLQTASPSLLGWEHDYRVIREWSCRAG